MTAPKFQIIPAPKHPHYRAVYLPVGKTYGINGEREVARRLRQKEKRSEVRSS